MALGPQVHTSAPWPERLLHSCTQSPSAASTNSTSSSASSAAFSLDATSSQSSATTTTTTSASGGWYESKWLNENVKTVYGGQPQQSSSITLQQQHQRQYLQSPQPQVGKVVAVESRQHPRRTQRLCQHESSTGDNAPRPPPSLIRQSERKVNFVDSLVDTATQMVDTIWPLSSYVQSRQADHCSRQPSKMELRHFIQEVLKRSKASYSTLQVALYYLVLIRPYVPAQDFTQEQPEDSPAQFSLQCGRRMFIAALILASKYLQDRNFSASGWSKISGLNTWDLNVNEMAFLKAIDWKLHVPDQLFHRWTDIVLRFSPSATMNGSRPSVRPRLSWREVVLRLTPQLDTVFIDAAELSDDSGYCSPGSDMSPPPLPVMREQLISSPTRPTPPATPTPTSTQSTSIPYWLAQTPTAASPSSSTSSEHARPGLPLQPHLAPLPTPDLTPQTDSFCTPAVSALGISSRGSSISRAMCHINRATQGRCTLDRTSEWRSRAVEGFPTAARRSSLATSASSVSSPDSTMSDVSLHFSDTSSRLSRSSSISSVASSACAPALPQRLAVQATRRCATMQTGGLKPSCSGRTNVAPGVSAGTSNQRFCSLPTATSSDVNGCSSQDTPKASFPSISSNSFSQTTEPRKLARSFEAHLASEDHEAASALQELALTSQTPHSFPTHRRSESRKRSRPNHSDLSVEDAVRQLIAPRCLADIVEHDSASSTADAASVLADEEHADTFLLRKEDKHVPARDARKRHPKAHRQQSFQHSSSASSASGKLSAAPRESHPRKRTCAGSERGGRNEARQAMMETSPSWMELVH